MPDTNSRMSIWSTDVGGSSTEGAFIAINGDSIYMSSPIDNNAINYWDEDNRVFAFLITQNGSINATCDARIKTDIKSLTWDDIFRRVKCLQPSTFKYMRPDTCTRDTNKFDIDIVGVIAQNLLESFPELVNVPENPEEYMTVNISMLVLPLFQCISEMIDIDVTLENRIASLETDAVTASARIAYLETIVANLQRDRDM